MPRVRLAVFFAAGGAVAAEGFAHGGIGLDVAHAVVVHDAEVAGAEGFGHSEGDLGFGLNDFGTVKLGGGFVFLLGGDGEGAAFFGFGLEEAFVGFGLVGLELGADVFADGDFGDIDRENGKRGAGVEPFAEDGFGDGVGVFEDFFIAGGGADGGDDALADAGDDGFFGGAADELLDVGADGDFGADLENDAVFGLPVDGLAAGLGVGDVDDFGIDGGLDGIEDVSAGEVDGGAFGPIELRFGRVRWAAIMARTTLGTRPPAR